MKVTLEVAMKAVLPHAGKDKTLPLLTHVHIDSEYVSATDRYTCARARHNLDLPDETSILVPADVVKQVIGAKKEVVKVGRDGDTVRLDYSDNSWTVFQAGDDGGVGWPNTHRFFDSHSAPTGEVWSHVRLNPSYVARFDAKHFPRHVNAQPVSFEFGETPEKPIRVTYSGEEWFEGLIMPGRV